MIYKRDNRPMKYHKGNIIAVISAVIILIFVGNFVYDDFIQSPKDNTSQMNDNTQSNNGQLPTITYPAQSEQIPPEKRGYGITPYGIQKAQTINQSSQSPQQSTPTSEIQPSLVNSIDLEHAIHDKINSNRADAGLRPLTYDEQVATMAREHSQDMALNNYFDHTSPDGKTLQNRIITARIPCFPDGENIEQTFTGDSPESIVQTWMDSQGHRDNILSPIYMREGIGVYVSLGNEFITEDFC